MPLGKMDIVKLLREKHGLGDFLEISTATTGQRFADMSGGHAATHRLVYNCPDDADDGQPYTFRTDRQTSRALIQAIAAANGNRPRYDLIFVDPFHSYACSKDDILGAFALLRPGGIMVIHDCNPREARIASPDFCDGEWCGVTYLTFIDFVLRRWDLNFCTVDTDYGCGVIYKHRARIAMPRAERAALTRLAPAWHAARHVETGRFDFFAQHRHDLLNLKTVEEFLSLQSA